LEQIILDPQPHLRFEGRRVNLSLFEMREIIIDNQVYDGVFTDKSGGTYLIRLSPCGDKGVIENLKKIKGKNNDN